MKLATNRSQPHQSVADNNSFHICLDIGHYDMVDYICLSKAYFSFLSQATKLNHQSKGLGYWLKKLKSFILFLLRMETKIQEKSDIVLITLDQGYKVNMVAQKHDKQLTLPSPYSRSCEWFRGRNTLYMLGQANYCLSNERNVDLLKQVTLKKRGLHQCMNLITSCGDVGFLRLPVCPKQSSTYNFLPTYGRYTMCADCVQKVSISVMDSFFSWYTS